jgi:hypothetical protein
MIAVANQQIAFSLEDVGPPSLAFVPDSTSFANFLETVPIDI